ncbi:MAG: 2-oxoglutarate and iron-dependent oxygenase domain-containing protein [Saprospiraceae bacterium]|nr:2-oxoglutarate and iron-dependent oxygenase domain-containing protein [Saprospiraceae bacterium]
MPEKGIPTVDLRTFIQGGRAGADAFVQALGTAFHEVGFVAVVNHGVDKALIDRFYAAARAFFALPEETKQRYEIPGAAGQRGYTAFGKEHAKQSTVADLKEFFQIGQEAPAAFPLHYAPNVAVAEVPDFLPAAMALFRAFEEAGAHLLRAIALFLKLDEQYFEPHITYGNSILRAIHYPPITREPHSAIRAEQHEDINLITLLVGASAGGLQLLTSEGRWVPIHPAADEIVINVGDMLQRLTNDFLKSTTHRVVNPPREEWHLPRLSIPFFLHPRVDMDLSCLPSCITHDNPLRYPPITAGEYLNERLREIGLK